MAPNELDKLRHEIRDLFVETGPAHPVRYLKQTYAQSA